MAWLHVAACLASASAQVFLPDDPIAVDDDRAFDASGAAEIQPSRYYDFIENTFLTPGENVDVPAGNVNTIDEVPDSTWFTNRIGQHPMSIATIVRGPDRHAALDIDGWPIVEGKGVGRAPGWRVRDPSGHLYQIEFDPPGHPEMMTGAEIIGTAFYHAFGYNVVEAYLVEIDPRRLVIADGATIEVEGVERPFRRLDIQDVLRRSAPPRGGRYRAVASRFADGEPLGHFKYYGTRPDDPNDIFPHEHRRELRGNRVFAAWLNHVDSVGINSLDMLVGPEGQKYIRHYMFDFGSILGSGTVAAHSPRAGTEYVLDWRNGFTTLATLGAYARPWVRTRYPEVAPSVGRFESTAFDPEDWRPEYPNPAFRNLRADDAFWAARIVSKFSDDAIRAVVAKAQYSDPAAADYIAETLIERRDKVVEHWLNQVNPVESFRVDASGVVTFDNAVERLGVGPPARRYIIRWYRFDNDTGGRDPVGGVVWSEGPRAQIPAELRTGTPFVLMQVRAVRARFPTWLRPVDVFFRRVENGWQTVGIHRGTRLEPEPRP